MQRSVTALLDELAPERVVRKIDRIVGPVEQYRTPSGCVLEAADAAVSVSWFADASPDAAFGELHVVVWRGKLARRGSAQSRKGATIVVELTLRPQVEAADDCQWEATDGTRYTTAALTAKCLALLESQISNPV